MSSVPQDRVRAVNRASVHENGDFVIYWMTANRRVTWNYALQHAIDRAQALKLPLLILDSLRADYPWASERFHRFVLQGMVDNHRYLDGTSVTYYPHVERRAGAGRRLLADLAKHAAVVVGDDSPMFFYPTMIEAAGKRLDVKLEVVDAAGLLPLRSAQRAYTTAHSFRRFVQRMLPSRLDKAPLPDPVSEVDLPRLGGHLRDLTAHPPTDLATLADPATLADLPIDHGVGVVRATGGSAAARRRLGRFVDELLPAYGQERNQPDAEHASRLSAYLHFGHISVHEIFATIASREMWSPAWLAVTATGARRGWWGMSEGSEAFLDQLVVWRELGLNTCLHRDDYDLYSSLPEWALTTLDEHRGDQRPYVYGLEELETGTTHDKIWNAAQHQLTIEGRIHGYLRMLWGKKILEWSATPEEALRAMIELNNKYALDGRDANSYSGIFWVLGRYDRPWGPERKIFGKVRYMSSDNTARKLRLKEYMRTYAPDSRPEATT